MPIDSEITDPKLGVYIVDFFFSLFTKNPPLTATFIALVLVLISVLVLNFIIFPIYNKIVKKDDSRLLMIIANLNAVIQMLGEAKTVNTELMHEIHILRSVVHELVKYTERTLSSISTDNFKKLMSALLTVFFTEAKRSVYDFLDNSNNVVEDFYKIREKINNSFYTIVIGVSRDFILKDNEFEELVNLSTLQLLNEFLLDNIELKIKTGKPDLTDRKVKSLFDYTFDNSKNIILEDVTTLYSKLVFGDGSLSFLKEV